jgi:hypothetical protein
MHSDKPELGDQVILNILPPKLYQIYILVLENHWNVVAFYDSFIQNPEMSALIFLINKVSVY